MVEKESPHPMITIGIDPSLTSSGIIVLRDNKIEHQQVTKNRPTLGTIQRVRWIKDEINNIIENLSDGECWQPPDLIVIEGFSYGSRGRGLFDIAYLGWRIREMLEDLRCNDGIPWIEVSPTQVKQFATGKGNSDKQIMLQQVYKHFGEEFSDDNLCDAYVLAKIGHEYFQWKRFNENDWAYNLAHMTSYQREIVKSLMDGKPQKKTRKVK